MKNLNQILLLLTFVSCSIQAQTNAIEDFIPNGYVFFEKVFGDLNNDKQEDCILIIKRTNKKNMVTNRFDEVVDRNRRGIIVLFKTENGFQKVTENLSCFLSENEDGGIYFAPQLYFNVNRGNLIIHYAHGRYGFWSYTFRYQDSKFKLIGYDETNGGGVVRNQISINFLTKKKLIRENINEDAKGGDEVFKETWSKISIDKLLNLSEIIDFDSLEMYKY